MVNTINVPHYFTDRDFVAARRVALERFLQIIVVHPLLRNTLIVRQFLDPHSYSQNFPGIRFRLLFISIK